MLRHSQMNPGVVAVAPHEGRELDGSKPLETPLALYRAGTLPVSLLRSWHGELQQVVISPARALAAAAPLCRLMQSLRSYRSHPSQALNVSACQVMQVRATYTVIQVSACPHVQHYYEGRMTDGDRVVSGVLSC